MRADVNFLTLTAALVCAAGAAPARADVVISSQATQNMNCSAGVCSPTATSAVLNVGDLETMLSSGNVEVTTTGSGIQAQNIRLIAALTWSSTSTLALDAYQSISIGKAVTVAGVGGLTIITNDGGSNGTFSFGQKGRVIFKNLSSALKINGQAFTLVNSLPALITAVSANSDGAYAFANNYDAGKDGTYGASPINTLDGTIEGLGNRISKLSINISSADAEEGLVGEVASSASIDNLRLVAIRYNVYSLNNHGVGGIAGNNDGYLFGDEVSGSIDANGNDGGDAGGFVDNNNGLIVACTADVNISTSGNGGGGGFADFNSAGTITLSHADGSFSGAVSGGFVGLNEGTLSEDFATGAVSGGETGGFAGNNEADVGPGTIENSYSTGTVTGGEAGGFVSLSSNQGPTVSNSYSTGAVPSEAGGFECDAYNFSNDYWDTTTSGTTYSGCFDTMDRGVTGLTSKQLRSGLPTGFDPKIWAEKKGVNNSFPYLIANPPVKK